MQPRADADYMRKYRQENPGNYARNLEANRAYRRALTALKEAHPAHFRRLLNLERKQVGLPPVGMTKPGPKRKAA